MPKFVDMQGRTIGLWEVISRDMLKTKRAYWLCKCIGCGVTASVSGTHLRENIKGGCRSCRNAGNASKYPLEYSVWSNIKTRTCNKNRKTKYLQLGMYEPWKKDFMLFYHAVGPRPSAQHSIDRIDNNKGYFPGNVRWATAAEQSRNTSRNLYISGEVLIDYAKRAGVPYNTLRDKYHKTEKRK